MSIRARILTLVGCFAAMAMIVTALGLMTIGDYNRMMKSYDLAYGNAWRGERLNHMVSNVVMETRGLYIARSPQELAGFVKGLNESLDDMEAVLKEWRGVAPPSDLARLEPISQAASRFIVVRRQVAVLAGTGHVPEAYTLSTGNRPDRIAFQTAVEHLVQDTRHELVAARSQAGDYGDKRARDFFLTALVGIIVMMTLTVWIVAHFITRPLRALASAIVRTARGDYDVSLSVHDGKDEISSVWRALAVLKARSQEAERLAAVKREAEHQEERKLREILLD